ncbi:hypothetical protein OPV22_012703 [Ensete ventricosum]|uniref:Uncharacterized protein n=1 Tax=Ensete ventricosum TaxID=4639 RepID=A0AAV8R3Q2_ENSVE|nr:hypothetical protein OPV22_012703 [Ensete ventricosum]
MQRGSTWILNLKLDPSTEHVHSGINISGHANHDEGISTSNTAEMKNKNKNKYKCLLSNDSNTGISTTVHATTFQSLFEPKVREDISEKLSERSLGVEEVTMAAIIMCIELVFSC